MQSTLISSAIPAALTAAELIRQARALKQVYQQTWRLEDVEAQICCYLRAIDLLCEASEDDKPRFASVTPAPKNSPPAGEPLTKDQDSHRACVIGAQRQVIIE